MALSGDPEDIYRTDQRVKELIPDDPHLHRWLDMARERIAFQGLPARICWVGLGQRHRLGLAFNEMVRNGEVSAPIVIGRDHLDSGSVASPNRETESMKDGSDVVSDWPLLNALLNTASGATWVSLHHGGGVGMGYSQHAGMVIVADGTDDAARRLERVLWNDPGTGVMRHADAGYRHRHRLRARAGPRPADGGRVKLDPTKHRSRRPSPALGRREARLDDASMQRVAEAAASVERIVAGGETVYGVNTGFGLLANTRIPDERLAELQTNLILSHSAGLGDPLPRHVTRLMIVLEAARSRPRPFGRAPAGDRRAAGLLDRDAMPLIPVAGQRRRVRRPRAARAPDRRADGLRPHRCSRRSPCPPTTALKKLGMQPLQLGPKEGLALINGTQASTALALDALFAGERVFAAAIAAGALSVDALKGSVKPFDPRISELRGQPGQIRVAAAIREPARRQRNPRQPRAAAARCRTPTASAASRR